MKIKTILVVVVIAVLAILSAIFLPRNTDFGAYWHGVRNYMNGTKPLYGPLSGMEYPQEFRYPPVTVLFFLPLTRLPLRVASFCWILMAWVACSIATYLAIRAWKLRFTVGGTLLGVIFLAPYVVLAVKFGNVQPYLIALVLLALLFAETHPGWSGLALAVAICFKVWPLFFAPWLLLRRRRSALYYAGGATAVLWTAPVLFFGWSRYLYLLQDFFTHVVALASGPEAVWYSSQSLRGVLLRLLTRSVHPRDGYPDVSFASLPPALMVDCYLVLSILIYGYAVFAMWRSDESRRWLWDAGAFVLFSALQPFCMNSSLISLLPAILAGAHVYSAPAGQFPAAAKRAFLVACVLVVLSISPYLPLQREVLMLGIDFWIMLALATGLGFAVHTGARKLHPAYSAQPI
ncbi:MAG TPA: glycosyltransferase family 87 protein [Bryobacteraceae bacterium]|nr:glycosyltransferase family 87 protein [Bryobacteraceae bacterium]